MNEREHLELGPQENLWILAARKSLINDTNDPLAHAVPKILDVLLRSEAVGRAEDVRFDEEEPDDLFEKGRESGEGEATERSGLRKEKEGLSLRRECQKALAGTRTGDALDGRPGSLAGALPGRRACRRCGCIGIEA